MATNPIRKTSTRKTAVRRTGKLNLTDLLRVAASDKRTAAALLKNPDSFAATYNLNAKQLAGLKDVASKIGPGIGQVATNIEYE